MAKKQVNQLEHLADLKELRRRELASEKPSDSYIEDLDESIADLEHAIAKRPYEWKY